MSSDFAIELARMVYNMHMTDADIHQATGDNSEWMQQQIDEVRSNPKLYKPMSNMWTLEETINNINKSKT